MGYDKVQAIVDDAKAVIDKTLTATADVEEKPKRNGSGTS